jgi:hypothetical protein
MPSPVHRTRARRAALLSPNGTAGPRLAGRNRATVRCFRLDGRQVSSQRRSPFRVPVHAAPARHTVSARITFRDATPAKTRMLRYRACAAAVLQPRPGPSRFTG